MSADAGLRYVLTTLHGGEVDAAEHLVAVADRHVAEHEVHHVATDLGAWSRENAAAVAEAGAAHGVTLDGHPDEPSRLGRALGRAVSIATGRRPEPGLLLLEDLQHLYLLTSQNSLAWELLAQHARARRERDLLELTEQRHPTCLRQIRWANTMLKTVAPQILSNL